MNVSWLPLKHNGKEKSQNIPFMIKYPLETIVACIIMGIMSIFYLISQIAPPENFDSFIDLGNNGEGSILLKRDYSILSSKYNSVGIVDHPQVVDSFNKLILTYIIDNVSYKDVCQKDLNGSCKLNQQIDDKTITMSLFFTASSAEKWKNTKSWMEGFENEAKLFFENSYASSSQKFFTMIENGNKIDALVFLFGYVLMHGTFFLLYRNMIKVGSKFSLATMVLCHGAIAFFMSLSLFSYLGFQINWFLLCEAIPFFVIAIGFRKPYIIASSVMKFQKEEPVIAMQNALNLVYKSLVWDIMKEISVFALFAFSGYIFNNFQIFLD